MRAGGGQIYYSRQEGSTLGDRMSFDQSAPYTICCNYKGFDEDSFTNKLCLIESPGTYSIGDAETKVLLAKDVTCILGDCSVDVRYFGTGNGYTVDISLYVGTTDDVLDENTVYLYRNSVYMCVDDRVTIDIPDISRFVVPSGKNVCLVVSGNHVYVSGRFVSCVDD